MSKNNPTTASQNTDDHARADHRAADHLAADSATRHDVIIFECGQQCFALPSTVILEVREPSPVTPLPFAPPFVSGLVNVAGQVMVQTEVNVLLDLSPRQSLSQGELLVIRDELGVSGVLHVDKVLAKYQVSEAWLMPSATESTDEVESTDETVAADAPRKEPAHIAEFQWGEKHVLLLDVRAFTLDQLTSQAVPVGETALLGQVSSEESVQEEAATAVALGCVLVVCSAECYALPMHVVTEILDTPEVTRVPHAPCELRGLVLVRDTPLLGISLSQLLGLPSQNLGGEARGESKLLIVDYEATRFGLLVDRVLGIEYFQPDACLPAEQGGELDSYLILRANAQRGESMVGLLSLARVLSEQRRASYQRYLVQNRDLETTLQDRVAKATRRLLGFTVGGEACALPLEAIERVEAYSVPSHLPQETEQGFNVEMSSAQAALVGMVQIRGEVAPVLDVRLLLGRSPQVLPSAFLMVRLDGELWALCVDKVDQVFALPEQDIEPLAGDRHAFIAAIGRKAGALLSILSLAPLQRAA